MRQLVDEAVHAGPAVKPIVPKPKLDSKTANGATEAQGEEVEEEVEHHEEINPHNFFRLVSRFNNGTID